MLQKSHQSHLVPDSSDKFIYWLFMGRCICCWRRATEINEIILRSRSKDALKDWKNRVPMCREHHEEYHHDGVSADKVQYLIERRREFLTRTNRVEYI